MRLINSISYLVNTMQSIYMLCIAEGLSIHQFGDAATVFCIMGFQLISMGREILQNPRSGFFFFGNQIRFSLQPIERTYYAIYLGEP